MARRKNSSLKIIMELTTMLPWWVGICLAVLAYFILHYVADLQLTPAVGLEVFGTSFVKQLAVSMAGVVQYVLPVIFIFGTIGSLVQKQKKDSLYGRLKQKPELQTLNDMNWQQFELLVGKYFETKGYNVRQLAQPGPDGGVDLVAIKDGERYLVQCKQWRSTSVGVKVVRELLGVIVSEAAVGGFVVASGQFTPSAKAFVQGRNIELIDGVEIVNSIDMESLIAPVASKSENLTGTKNPICPTCGSAMVLRTTKKGIKVGSQFWGCSTFPKCRGLLQLE
ncbi:MAG: restriction system protein [Candidatus Azotimanducaceae bacterium]|jgi:restriction system protein